jgi:hypothetical protein
LQGAVWGGVDLAEIDHADVVEGEGHRCLPSSED